MDIQKGKKTFSKKIQQKNSAKKFSKKIRLKNSANCFCPKHYLCFAIFLIFVRVFFWCGASKRYSFFFFAINAGPSIIVCGSFFAQYFINGASWMVDVHSRRCLVATRRLLFTAPQIILNLPYSARDLFLVASHTIHMQKMRITPKLPICKIMQNHLHDLNTYI